MVGEEMSTESGFFLPVENVQALASNNSGEIPSRYLRPELQSEEVLADESIQIPTIDMRKLMVAEDEMGKLHYACKEWGFFQLINHGVAEEVIEKMKADLQEFFKLPLKEKNAYAKLPNGVEGYGQHFVVSQDQKLDWADILFLQCRPASERNMRFWPQEPTSFRATFDKYSSELQKVSICLLELMAKNLKVDPGQLMNMFQKGRQQIRMNYYPPCVHASKVIGLTPHSDICGLTLLAQVNEVQGLQIKKNGKWIPIRPVPGAFIVNIGDILEIMSNGEYKSIEHRAVVNPETERLSIAAFHSPSVETIIGPLPELVKENGAIYKSVSREEYYKFAFSRKLDGKSIISHMKLEN
ncbi:S-norcoclaurine synthase 1 [Vitis vinifera]|uniref:Fe2OG dioxygenase domain-containing protein n=1 Tax=Vitis vinifera TaxID=29760 RepID=D7TTH8_VITVI|eukprot:XP_002279355.1 PREDICTED: S-norcoclaurine synthase 1 [Vitis vinifera]